MLSGSRPTHIRISGANQRRVLPPIRAPMTSDAWRSGILVVCLARARQHVVFISKRRETCWFKTVKQPIKTLVSRVSRKNHDFLPCEYASPNVSRAARSSCHWDTAVSSCWPTTQKNWWWLRSPQTRRIETPTRVTGELFPHTFRHCRCRRFGKNLVAMYRPVEVQGKILTDIYALPRVSA